MSASVMTDAECVALLQWALPQLELRWPGYRKVRGQVCKRIRRRIVQLGLSGAAGYRARLEADPEEWKVLDALCVVTISRLYRDRGVWEALRDEVLPALAEATVGDQLRCWSIGCASGEEPYTLSILWSLALSHRYRRLGLRILATDIDEQVLARARAATYAGATLRELPDEWVDQAFEQRDDSFELRDRFRSLVEVRRQDVRRALPDAVFELVLCRNVVFTYFEESLQQQTLDRIASKLSAGGALVVGAHEQPPSGAALDPWLPSLGIYRRRPGSARS